MTSPTISGYLNLERIGEGRTSLVYSATEGTTGRTDALKILKAEAGAEDTLRFRREYDLQSQLHHPHIACCYKLVELPSCSPHEGDPGHGQYMIVMELLGPLLFDPEEEVPYGSPRAVSRFIQQIASAAGYAHRLGIVHRDLKPANILETSERTPKITDFGVARRELNEAQDGKGRTRNTILGTWEYLAPELAQNRGSAEATPQSDVYSLGVILYQFLTGKLPLNIHDVSDFGVLRDRYPEPPTRPDGAIPGALVSICMKCLEKAACDRYANANELADDLGRFLADSPEDPVQARPLPLGTRLRRYASNSPVTLAIRLALSVFTLGAILWAVHATRLAGLANAASTLAQTNEAEAKRQTAIAEANEGEAKRQAAIAETHRLAAVREVIRGASIAYSSVIRETPFLLAEGELERAYQRLFALTQDENTRKNLGFEYYHLKALFKKQQQAVRREVAAGENPAIVSTLSPDGKKLAVGSADGTVELWDFPAGTRPATAIYRHTKPVQQLAFSPDGKKLASLAYEEWTVASEVKFWDMEKRSEATATPHSIAAVAMTWVGNNRLAWAGTNLEPQLGVFYKGKIVIWDTKKNARHRILTHGERMCHALVASADGQVLVTSGTVPAVAEDGENVENAQVKVWDHAADGDRWVERDDPLTTGYDRHFHLALTRDKKTLAVVTSGSATLWDLSIGKKVGDVLGGPTHLIRCATFTPDGKTLALADANGQVTFCDTTQRVSGKPWSGHFGAINSLSVTPDGKVAVSAGVDGTLRFWDPRCADRITCLATPTSGPLVAAGTANGLVYLTHTGTRQTRIFSGDPSPITAVALSPSGDSLVVGSKAGHIRSWDAQIGEQRFSLATGKPIRAIAYAPSGQAFAAAGEDGKVRLWDRHEAPPQELLGHAGPVTHLAFNARGDLAGASPNQVVLWNALGKQLRILNKLKPQTVQLAWKNNGNLRILGMIPGIFSNTYKLTLYDCDNNKTQEKECPFEVKHTASLMNELGIILADEDSLHVLTFAGGQIQSSLVNTPIHHLAVIRDRNGVVTVGENSPILMMRHANPPREELFVLAGAPLPGFNPGERRLDTGPGEVATLAFAPGQSLLATCKETIAGEAEVRIWDTSTGELLQSFTPAEAPMALAFASDSRQVAFAGKAAYLFDRQAKKLVPRQIGGGSWARWVGMDMAFGPGNETVLLATAQGNTGEVRRWAIPSGDALDALPHTGPVMTLALSQDRTRLVTGESSGKIRVWRQREKSWHLEDERREHRGLSRLVLSPDGKILATTNGNGAGTPEVLLWTLDEPDALPRRLAGHPGKRLSLAISPDSKTLVAGGLDKRLVFWSIASGLELMTLRSERPISSLAFSSDGETLAVGEDGSIRLLLSPRKK